MSTRSVVAIVLAGCLAPASAHAFGAGGPAAMTHNGDLYRDDAARPPGSARGRRSYDEAGRPSPRALRRRDSNAVRR